jgi:hypothetical protein
MGHNRIYFFLVCLLRLHECWAQIGLGYDLRRIFYIYLICHGRIKIFDNVHLAPYPTVSGSYCYIPRR